MENKYIIIILVVVIIVLAAIMGMMFLQQTNAKEPTKIKITSNKTLYEGDGLSIKLTDSNNTAISDENVDVTIADKDGNVVLNETVKTNSKGKVKVNLSLDNGKYNVTVTYGGNDNFTGCNTTQKLTIKEEEKVVEEPVAQQSTQSSSSSNEIHYDAEINVYYDSNGVIVDPDGKHPQGVGSSYDAARDARDRWERGEPVMV